MARFGTNMKITVAIDHREAMRRVLQEVLKCERTSPNDSIDLFAFEDGASMAVDYVAAEATLSPEQCKDQGCWVEFAVDDHAATAKALDEDPAVEAFSFVTPHRYFQLPGGQVFRLQE